MNSENKRAVIYCRVSTKEQVDEGNSLSTQEKICKEFALKNSYEVIEVFIEQGESAKTADRTQLQKLLSYCALRKNKIDVVIAYKLDRISRNTDDYSQIRLLLKRYGVEIKSCTEYFENTPAGRFMENIIANVAQFDNDVRTERSVNGMRDAMREGRYVWKAPIGYDNSKVGGKSNLSPNRMAPLVQKTFSEIAQNKFPIEEIRRQMIKEGLSLNHGRPINRGYFYRLLKNELYAGWIIKFGERHKGIYEPIVTDEIFEQVQRVLTFRGRKNLHYATENPDFPLRRFIRHSSGAKLTGGWSKGKYKKYPYYRFHTPKINLRKKDFEERFKALLDSFTFDETKLTKLKKFIKLNLIDKTEENIKHTESLQKQVADLKERQRQLVHKNLEGVISNDLLRQQLSHVDRELLDIHALLTKQPQQSYDFNELWSCIKGYLKKPSAVWEQAPFKSKLELQVFKFPQGLVFDGVNFRTPEVCSFFNTKNDFSPPKSPKVPLRNRNLNSSNKGNKINAKLKEVLPEDTIEVYHDKIIHDILRLSELMKKLRANIHPEAN